MKRIGPVTRTQEAREKEAKEVLEEALRIVTVAGAEREAERFRGVRQTHWPHD